jgi:DNA sulfur modification protein DndB
MAGATGTPPALGVDELLAEAAALSAGKDRASGASDSGYKYVFPAIRGVQAGRIFFVTMCPLKLIAKLFVFDDDELPPELRAQRTLNKGRLPEMVRYILDNPEGYTFSALTASVDGAVRFAPDAAAGPRSLVGTLHVPMSATFVINDGQHRHAAVREAIRQLPQLGEEMIAVVFFLDVGLERCQQMFADLNRHAVRPSKSIGVLYDHRDKAASLSRQLVLESPVFRGFVELESSSLPKASRRLFTLSAVHGATRGLLDGLDGLDGDAALELAGRWWAAVDARLPEWADVRERRLRSPDVRADLIHTHGITLAALGRIGNTLLREDRDPAAWEPRLAGLETVDWSRSNPLWEGRALIGGRVVKGQTNVLLTSAAIRAHLGLRLPADEQRAEDAHAAAAGARRTTGATRTPATTRAGAAARRSAAPTRNATPRSKR